LNYHFLHNSSVFVAFIGTAFLVIEVLREMEALELPLEQSLDIPGLILLIIGSVVAAWTAKKMDSEDN
jgi:hypothetical protein